MTQDEQARGDEQDGEVDGLALRNVSWSTYAGRPAVVVRTTHLQGSDGERRMRGGLRRLAREGRLDGLRD